ncbi:MAG: hypothetical protein ACI9W2_005306, partial [Gammaproteobacteria bacterium]
PNEAQGINIHKHERLDTWARRLVDPLAPSGQLAISLTDLANLNDTVGRRSRALA